MDRPRPRPLHWLTTFVGDLWRFTATDDDGQPRRLYVRVGLTALVLVGAPLVTGARAVACRLPGTLAYHLRRDRQRQAALATELDTDRWAWRPVPGRTYQAACEEVDVTHRGDTVVLSGVFDITEVTDDGVGSYKHPYRITLPAGQLPLRHELQGLTAELEATADGGLHARTLTTRFDM